MSYTKPDPYQEGIDAYLTKLFDTPIHALAVNSNRFTVEERRKFAEGFKYAEELFEKENK